MNTNNKIWIPTEQDILIIIKDINDNIQINTEIGEPVDELQALLQTVTNRPYAEYTKCLVQDYYQNYVDTVEYDMCKHLLPKENFEFICKILGISENENEEIEELK